MRSLIARTSAPGSSFTARRRASAWPSSIALHVRSTLIRPSTGSPTSRAVTRPPALATAEAADAMSDALSRITRIVTE